MKFYIDTCIWRDYFENRSDNFRPLGEWALSLLKGIIKREEIIFFSEITVNELRIKYTDIQIRGIFNIVQQYNLLQEVKIGDVQIREMNRISSNSGIPRIDCLHAILARDNGAVLVTRDKHFAELQRI